MGFCVLLLLLLLEGDHLVEFVCYVCLGTVGLGKGIVLGIETVNLLSGIPDVEFV